MERTVEDGQILPGMRQIDMVRLDLHPVGGLAERHARTLSEQARQETGATRGLMRHDDERHSAVGRHVPEEFLQRLQPACRRADPNDGKTFRL